jgi:DNA polymerase alpha subunit A
MLNDENEGVSIKNVYDEFERIAPKHKIHTFKSRQTVKKYCFGEDNVPNSCEYLEVCYAGSLPPLPENLQGNTFSKVFGTHSSMLENFLLDKKLRGPCWLQITNPVQVDSGQQQSWSKIEVTINKNFLHLEHLYVLNVI